MYLSAHYVDTWTLHFVIEGAYRYFRFICPPSWKGNMNLHTSHVAQYRQYELLIIHFAYYKECIKKYLCFAQLVLMEIIYFCQYQNNILYSINEMKYYPNIGTIVYTTYDTINATIINCIFCIIKVPLQNPTSNFISQIIDLFMD